MAIDVRPGLAEERTVLACLRCTSLDHKSGQHCKADPACADEFDGSPVLPGPAALGKGQGIATGAQAPTKVTIKAETTSRHTR